MVVYLWFSYNILSFFEIVDMAIGLDHYHDASVVKHTVDTSKIINLS